jgi:hypothetical protein
MFRDISIAGWRALTWRQELQEQHDKLAVTDPNFTPILPLEITLQILKKVLPSPSMEELRQACCTEEYLEGVDARRREIMWCTPFAGLAAKYESVRNVHELQPTVYLWKREPSDQVYFVRSSGLSMIPYFGIHGAHIESLATSSKPIANPGAIQLIKMNR